jgi:uncharacterized membrane protein YidH (DUF202 family)
MDWVPLVFITFKVLALGIAMFYAIKWHYDQGEKGATLALLCTGAKMTAIFALVLLAVVFAAFHLSTTLGLDLSLP